MDRSNSEHSRQREKKPYRKPRLSQHGPVSRLVNGGSKADWSDHGANMMRP
jgi:hypothetical protein